ncbi:MAG: TIGR03013 family PEP-CTERM/XrtA system glycosyltransferase [Thiohalocapsa sp.]|jgi:sugar transferase (PEP-CTERM system associated)|uniref:TIGR03013 family XrtA/PEP-CTERM system glycosyltransferase n=1 Tax=Thiohalocapsa sp. TaxID=2497641 RepID=UPI0025F749C3|nr:TIGR03013 family XrtA/PEP-CTERM system glycosyltransferase [Thiohalocapsa sp.]MCG6940176.1 TIGR03013 family PEP-CTERM/XrtA system glycosyltransferase [Thiohalocapsa sp.]
MIRLFGHHVSAINLVLALLELTLFFGALHLGVGVRFGWQLPHDIASGDPWITGAVFALVLSFSLASMGLYQRRAQDGEAGFLVRLGIAFVIGTTLLALLFYLFPALFMGRGILALSLLFSFIGTVLLRVAFDRIAGAEWQKRRVLVLGAGVNAERIAEVAERGGNQAFCVVGYVPLPRSQRLLGEDKLLAQTGSLLELAIAHNVDEIVVAADDRRRKLPVGELLDCRLSGFGVQDLLTFFEKEQAAVKIDLLHPSWIFFSRDGFRMGVTGLYGKRLLDLMLGSLMLLLAAPVMLLVALASLIESRGRDPILYHQIRVGQGGLPFRLHKFRSMRVDAEADGRPRWAAKNDARITRLGAFLRRTRLDELPQLFNVLKGQMSLVGPRPERPEFVERLTTGIPYYAERHRVKPGLTGWAQLLYPYGSDEEDAKSKLEFDLYYVKNAGIFLDLIILLQTVEVVLLGKGAR